MNDILSNLLFYSWYEEIKMPEWFYKKGENMPLENSSTLEEKLIQIDKLNRKIEILRCLEIVDIVKNNLFVAMDEKISQNNSEGLVIISAQIRILIEIKQKIYKLSEEI